MKKEINFKFKIKLKNILNKKIIIIKKYIRGYLIRKRLKLENNAAIKIQKIFRGYIFRYFQKYY